MKHKERSLNMCVFSKEASHSRDAAVGEPLVTHNFGHAVGFRSIDDERGLLAVCVLSGSKLRFDEPIRFYSQDIIRRQGWRSYFSSALLALSEVTTTFTTAVLTEVGTGDTRKDMLTLPDGRTMLLSSLRVCQRACVADDVVNKIIIEAHAAAAAELAGKGDAPAMEGWHAPARQLELI